MTDSSDREERLQVAECGAVPAVQATNLTKRFGRFTAVDRVSFGVERGSIFGFLGPNGAGKTTTIRILLGLRQPTSGEAMVLGLDTSRQPRQVRSRMGYMSQRFSLYEDLSVAENLHFCARTYGVRGRRLAKRKEHVLGMAGLEGHERTLARHLAGGWKQRLALGAAIMHEQEILFLDEPIAGVDPISHKSFWNLLYDLASAGTTILVTTHYMDEAEHCQKLAFIQRGRIAAQGAPAATKETEMEGGVLEIDCSDPRLALGLLRASGEYDEVSLYGSLIHAIAPEAASRVRAVERLLLGRGVLVRSVDIIAPSLEDVFISSLRGAELGGGERRADRR